MRPESKPWFRQAENELIRGVGLYYHLARERQRAIRGSGGYIRVRSGKRHYSPHDLSGPEAFVLRNESAIMESARFWRRLRPIKLDWLEAVVLLNCYFLDYSLPGVAELVRMPVDDVLRARETLVAKVAQAMGRVDGAIQVERGIARVPYRERLREVEELWMQGFRGPGIAMALGITPIRVRKDLGILRKMGRLRLYTMADVARRYGISKPYVKDLVRRGVLKPAFPLTPGRVPRFTSDEVEKLGEWFAARSCQRRGGTRRPDVSPHGLVSPSQEAN